MKKKHLPDDASPLYGSLASGKDVVLKKLRKKPISAHIAYQLIKDQLIDEGNARQNLATFCQTYMEPEVTKLMSETMEKNAIDKSEYPEVARLETSCVNVLADLWNAPDAEEVMGTSTVGSSEACMLGGMAMKFRWRNLARERGLDLNAQKPNLVISSGYQVCWEKFCVYWDIEMREVPMDEEHLSINLDKVMDYVDEYTIGIVGILGITYTGKFDDIEALDQLVEKYNETHEHQLVIHVDGASGAMFVPFVDPDLAWDFRLKNVVSINTSGHKYGLVYPGVGWILWRNQEYLPKELIFDVSYLGGNMPTMAINFSRSASQVVGQFYNFYRLGYEGYREIHKHSQKAAMNISKAIEETGLFKLYNDGENLPIVCYTLKEDADVSWNLYELADRLQMKGWQVPAYPLPADLDDIVIQRFVCRADLGQNLADSLIEDFLQCIEDLNHARVLFHDDDEPHVHGFTH
ncbi:glutamate decarboxylase [Kurthia gibsonii]|uniref:glutamate decarboxylase n=1 Tax=Kurthia TaxID=1649 RepID=UPI000745ADB2|nr:MULTISPECIES: glutamate decarboxylase [Kurthia]MCA9723695.1 glutamate decarboxylase [Kurthia sp.]AMA62559.1 glutamate decarboxylase [Kurthia sp. 11kri321]MEB6113518.1 glutamate decarboxylase [Kurthia gibsonii]RXH51583.1 glutamate decarboxylase [Kurthia gibsonii]WIL38456.1 glutamate decarboxylase [Kurthia sp. YJT4]